MAGSFNKVILVGRVVRDPEIRYIGSRARVVKFSIAVNPNKRDAKPEDTLFVDIVAWEKLAETCNTYLKKGMNVLVEERLVIRSYDDKDGNKRKATEVVINTMQILDSARIAKTAAIHSQAPASAPQPAAVWTTRFHSEVVSR
jgi:single-strand DNA-binding protein